MIILFIFQIFILFIFQIFILFIFQKEKGHERTERTDRTRKGQGNDRKDKNRTRKGPKRTIKDEKRTSVRNILVFFAFLDPKPKKRLF
jgi:uncharacterized membrane protein